MAQFLSPLLLGTFWSTTSENGDENAKVKKKKIKFPKKLLHLLTWLATYVKSK